MCLTTSIQAKKKWQEQYSPFDKVTIYKVLYRDGNSYYTPSQFAPVKLGAYLSPETYDAVEYIKKLSDYDNIEINGGCIHGYLTIGEDTKRWFYGASAIKHMKLFRLHAVALSLLAFGVNDDAVMDQLWIPTNLEDFEVSHALLNS